MKVAVIGGGAAGLCALRHLLKSNRIVPSLYEQSGSIGGTWVYTDKTGLDDRGELIHSSMYESLRTNLPKEVMAFPDFPFREQEQSFLHHSKVLEYLKDYCENFGLEKYIHLNTKVETVKPAESAGNKWEIIFKCTKTNITSTDFFDGVLVCNGHYSEPNVPVIPDSGLFGGRFIHSHDYRKKEEFRGQNVIVLGAAASGTDIAVELASVVNQVYLSHNGPLLQANLPSNVAQIRGIEKCIGETGFLLRDGSRVQCDAVILATGYHFTFPFLSKECKIVVENNQVKPLYKHFLNIEHNSMGIIGLPLKICPFPLFDRQIQYFIKILLGEVEIPSKEDMYTDTEKEREYRLETLGMREKYFHQMGDLQWEYNDEISKLAQIPPLDPVVKNLYCEVWERRRKDLVSYKQDCFNIIGNGAFQERKHVGKDIN